MRIGIVLDWNLNVSGLMNIARNTFRELGELMNETKSFTISAIPLNSIKIGDINQHFDCIHIPNMGGYKFPYEESLRCKNLILAPIGIDEVIYGSEVFADKSLWKRQVPIIKKNVPMWKENIAKISAVHVVAKSERAEMNKHLGIPLEKMEIIQLGVNHNRFTPADNKNKIREKIISKFEIPTKNYFIHISETNYARKNIFRLLDAFENARKKGIPQKLVLIGNLHKEVKDRLKNYPNVLSLGYVSDADLVELIQGSDALVLPSIHEGFGIPLVESMACGIPCITSDRHTPPEVVGDAGLLVDPYDVSDIANKMIEINDGDTLQTLSKRALQRSQDYSWKTSAAKILELYEKHTAFTGKWDFQKAYDIAAYQTVTTTCLLFANEERGVFVQSLLRSDYSKIIQWALEYGLNDPKSRDFLVPFKNWLEQQSKKYEVTKLPKQEEKIEQSREISTKEIAELEILNNFLWDKNSYNEKLQITHDNENIKWLLETSKQHFLQSLQNKFEYYEKVQGYIKDQDKYIEKALHKKTNVIKGLEQSKEETQKYIETALHEKTNVEKGLEQSKEETQKYIETALHEKTNVIKGLEQSKEESNCIHKTIIY